MRTILAGITLCILLAACSKSEPMAQLQSGGTLTLAERSSLAGIHPLLTNWTPTSSGSFAHSGVTHHVYLKDHGIGGSVSGYRGDLLVFASDGRLVDAGIFHLGSERARSFLSLSPLRLRLSFTDDHTRDIACEIPHDAAIQQFRKDLDADYWGQERRPRFLSNIPEFRDLSLKMSEDHLKAHIEKHRLYAKTELQKKRVTYWVLTPAGENVFVDFESGKCKCIDRMQPIPKERIKDEIGASEYRAWMEKQEGI